MRCLCSIIDWSIIRFRLHIAWAFYCQDTGFHINTLTFIHYYLSNICQKELKYVHRVRGKIHFLVFRRDPYWDPCYLWYTCVTHFTPVKTSLQAIDDSTVYNLNKTKESVIGVLETSSSPAKSHLYVICRNQLQQWLMSREGFLSIK